MSQRNSGYARLKVYETPAWVTQALLPHMKGVRSIWEPACGKGSMVKVMRNWLGVKARGTDIADGTDFLKIERCQHDAIITNPPFEAADLFIAHALRLVKPFRGRVAMLLRTDYDHAKTRQYLFGHCAEFAKKVVLTSRIRWIEGSTGSPSENHAWFIWDWTHIGDPVIKYHIETNGELTKRLDELHNLENNARVAGAA